MKLRKRLLLGRTFEGGQVFVYRAVERLELFFWQGLLVLIADVNASFLKGVDQRGIGPDIGHGVNKNVAHFGVSGLGLHFAAFPGDPLS